MRRILVPFNLGVGATRHLLWYISYQITGEARHRGPTAAPERLPSLTARLDSGQRGPSGGR